VAVGGVGVWIDGEILEKERPIEERLGDHSFPIPGCVISESAFSQIVYQVLKFCSKVHEPP
jgi:hypothetical protein